MNTTISGQIAEVGIEPTSTGYEPVKEPLLYSALIKNMRYLLSVSLHLIPSISESLNP
jgi:hypothetical protein